MKRKLAINYQKVHDFLRIEISQGRLQDQTAQQVGETVCNKTTMLAYCDRPAGVLS